MANDLTVLEGQLAAYEPRFAAAIPRSADLQSHQMIQTILVSCERTPRLLECTRESLLQSSMTAANLGLIVDGVSGQGYLVPYKEKGILKAQFQPGYKGYITLGARGGWIIHGTTVRENDPLRIVEGDEPRIFHEITEHTVGDGIKGRGRIIGAYAIARSNQFPTTHTWMSLAEIERVRDKASKAAGSDFSPWKTWPEAMIRKTPVRMLGARMPMTSQLPIAAALETQHDLGRFAYVEDGIIHTEGKAFPAEQLAPDKSTIERIEDQQTEGADD